MDLIGCSKSGSSTNQTKNEGHFRVNGTATSFRYKLDLSFRSRRLGSVPFLVEKRLTQYPDVPISVSQAALLFSRAEADGLGVILVVFRALYVGLYKLRAHYLCFTQRWTPFSPPTSGKNLPLWHIDAAEVKEEFISSLFVLISMAPWGIRTLQLLFRPACQKA